MASLAARRACVAGGGGDGEDRLADELDEVGGEQGLVVAVGRADVVLARDVGCGQHADHALGGAHRVDIDPGDPRVRLGREAELDVQQAGRLGQVVDVERLAGDVAAGAVVRARASWAAPWTRSDMGETPLADEPGRGRGGGLDMQPAQEVAGDIQAVAGRGAHVGDRLEVLAEGGHAGLDGGLGPSLPEIAASA